MSDKPDFKIFCRDLYKKTWEQEYLLEYSDASSNAAKQAARLAAQRKAIDKVLVDALLEYSPEVPEDEIWKEIGITHKLNVAELDDFGINEEDQPAG